MVQYIGARYVPAFYGDWTANTEYDPLTIVTYNGNSYTSKTKVPAAVGAPDVNAQYWAATGSYNAQVQDLQDKFSNFHVQDTDGRPITYFDSNKQYFSSVNTAELDNIDLAAPEESSADIANTNDVRSPLRAYFNPGNAFRFALRMPANNSFTVAQFLTALQQEKDIYAQYQWVYYTESPDYQPGVFNTIPLYDVNNPAIVYNPNGKGTSCATAICNVMYKLGWTDLAGNARYSEARVPEVSMPYYLQEKNWIRIDDPADLQAGDIVFSRANIYADERRMNPHHEFVYAGNGMAYDFGSTSLIQNGGLSPADFTGDPMIQTIWENARVLALAAGLDPYNLANNRNYWTGNIFVGRDDYDKPVRIAEFRNVMNGAEMTETVVADPDTQTFTTNKYLFPATRNNSTSGLMTIVKIYKSGRIIVKINGTPSTTLTAGTAIELFDFDAFSYFKVLSDPFTEYKGITAAGDVALFEIATVNGTARLRMTPQVNISSEIHTRLNLATI